MSGSRQDVTGPLRDRFGTPGVSYPTPVKDDIVVVEEFLSANGNYDALEYGAEHPKRDDLKLILQQPVKGDQSQKAVRRIYANDRTAQESYNFSLGYVCDGKDYLRVLRKKMVPRATYAKLAEFAPDPDFPPALLTSEETTRCEPEYDSLYLWVTYTYETLPGPLVPFTRYDNDLGPIQGTRRLVRNTGQASALALNGSVDYDARDQSTLVAWEKREGWTDGTGAGDNPAFPINYASEYQEEKGAVLHQLQLTANPSTNAATLASTGGGIRETRYTDFNNFLQKLDTSRYTLPGPPIQREVYDPEKGKVTIVTQLVLKASQDASISLSGSTVTEVELEPFNTLVYRQKTSIFIVPGPVLTRYSYDAETGHLVTTTTQIVAKPANGTGYGEVAGQTTEYRPENDVYGLKVITTFDTTGNFTRNEVKDQPYSYPGLLFGITGSLLEAKNGIARVILNASRRSPRTRIVSHHVAITYGQEGNLTEPAVFDPVLANLIYDGAFFSVNERNVLNDAISLSYTTGTDNPIWGLKTEAVTFAASALSATGYFNLLGQYKIVNVIKEKWKYGLWRMAVISVPLR